MKPLVGDVVVVSEQDFKAFFVPPAAGNDATSSHRSPSVGAGAVGSSFARGDRHSTVVGDTLRRAGFGAGGGRKVGLTDNDGTTRQDGGDTLLPKAADAADPATAAGASAAPSSTVLPQQNPPSPSRSSVVSVLSLPSTIPSSSLSSSSASSSSSSYSIVSGYSCAYIHTSAAASALSFFDVAGTNFLLQGAGAGAGTTRRATTRTTTPQPQPRGGGGSGAFDSQFASPGLDVDSDALFLPQVLQLLGNKELVLSLFRKLQDDIVAEVTCRLVVLDGGTEQQQQQQQQQHVALFFESIDKAELGLEALDKLKQRKGRLDKRVKEVTNGTEIGCLLLVSTVGDGRRFGTNPEINVK